MGGDALHATCDVRVTADDLACFVATRARQRSVATSSGIWYVWSRTHVRYAS